MTTLGFLPPFPQSPTDITDQGNRDEGVHLNRFGSSLTYPHPRAVRHCMVKSGTVIP